MINCPPNIKKSQLTLTLAEYNRTLKTNDKIIDAIMETASYFGERFNDEGITTHRFYTCGGTISSLDERGVCIKSWDSDVRDNSVSFPLIWLIGSFDERKIAMDAEVETIKVENARLGAMREANDKAIQDKVDRKEFERLKEKFGET